MRSRCYVAVLVLVLVGSIFPKKCLALPITVGYQASDLGGGHWKYIYDVRNDSFSEPIQEFTIWFDRAKYRTLQVATPNPPAADWDELVVQPDPILHDDGFYDARALGAGILVGSQETGFVVQFDWLGSGGPGRQPFDIVNPITLQVEYSGMTVPEPSAWILLAGGIAAARRWRVRRGLRR